MTSNTSVGQYLGDTLARFVKDSARGSAAVSHYANELAPCPLESNCGRDCGVVIDLTASLLGVCHDLSEAERVAIVAAACHQISVLYFG